MMQSLIAWLNECSWHLLSSFDHSLALNYPCLRAWTQLTHILCSTSSVFPLYFAMSKSFHFVQCPKRQGGVNSFTVTLVYTTIQPSCHTCGKLKFLPNHTELIYKICSTWEPFLSIIRFTRLDQEERMPRIVFKSNLSHSSTMAFFNPSTVVARRPRRIRFRFAFTP